MPKSYYLQIRYMQVSKESLLILKLVISTFLNIAPIVINKQWMIFLNKHI